MTVLVILALLFALLLSGIPVAFALGGLGALLLAYAGFSEQMAPAALLSSMDSFVLIAVPLFLLMSNIMLKGGVGKDLFEAVQAWVGHLPGGLAVATVLSCGIFAAISGSSVATAATIGTVAIPRNDRTRLSAKFRLWIAGCRGHAGHFDPAVSDHDHLWRHNRRIGPCPVSWRDWAGPVADGIVHRLLDNILNDFALPSVSTTGKLAGPVSDRAASFANSVAFSGGHHRNLSRLVHTHRGSGDRVSWSPVRYHGRVAVAQLG